MKNLDSVISAGKAHLLDSTSPIQPHRPSRNTYEIATPRIPGAKGLNPLTLWDLHWLKELDDEGFIDQLMKNLAFTPGTD